MDVTRRSGSGATRTGPVVAARGGRRAGAVAAAALVVSALGLTGCSVVKVVKKIEQNVRGNRSTIDAFTTKIQSGESATFEATYATTGGSPATIVYAVEPPKGLAFTDTPSGAAGASATSVDVIVNATGEYSCSPPSSSGSGPTCQMLGTAAVATENKLFELYTPAHWVSFLRDFSLVAGIAGDEVTSSDMSVNGFSMQCVDFVASGVPGTSTICTTAQGILGYVKVASNPNQFRDQELFGLTAAITVRVAARRHHHDHTHADLDDGTLG